MEEKPSSDLITISPTVSYRVHRSHFRSEQRHQLFLVVLKELFSCYEKAPHAQFGHIRLISKRSPEGFIQHLLKRLRENAEDYPFLCTSVTDEEDYSDLGLIFATISKDHPEEVFGQALLDSDLSKDDIIDYHNHPFGMTLQDFVTDTPCVRLEHVLNWINDETTDGSHFVLYGEDLKPVIESI